MANASDLPTEIWLLIAWYLPKSQLFRLITLNSFFLNCWMDSSWRQVEIDTEVPADAIRLLLRMADEFVAMRTKKLTVCLRHFKTKETLSSSKSTLSKLRAIVLLRQKSQAVTFQSALVHLLQCLPRLPNITYLKIDLWHIPLALLPTLFQTITTSPVAKTLQTLCLSGHVDMFASLAVYSTNSESPFVNLAELNLELLDRHLLDDCNVNDGLLSSLGAVDGTTSLARFILSLSSSLQLLRLWSWSNTLDLSRLFSHLSQPLPNLQSLFLIVPFNTSIQSSAESLRCFLLTHSNTLQHLQLRLKMARVQLEPGMEEPPGTWLTQFVNSVSLVAHSELISTPSPFFPNLQSLDIYPSMSPSGLSALLTFIKRTAPTLSSLTIRDRYLTSEETKQVLDVLIEGQSRKLKSLRMNITHLSVSFLYLLAQKLPQLRELWLSVSEIVASDQYSFYEILLSRRHELARLSIQEDCLSTWKLQKLSILQAGQDMDDAVHAVASAVPSVILGGRDDGSSDEEY